MSIVKFECVNPFDVPKYDEYGFPMHETMKIEKGEVFECDTEIQERMVGSWHDTLRLSNGNKWIEITKENVRANFVEIAESMKGEKE